MSIWRDAFPLVFPSVDFVKIFVQLKHSRVRISQAYNCFSACECVYVSTVNCNGGLCNVHTVHLFTPVYDATRNNIQLTVRCLCFTLYMYLNIYFHACMCSIESVGVYGTFEFNRSALKSAVEVHLITVRLINFRLIKHFHIADLMNKICMNIKESWCRFLYKRVDFKIILMNFPGELYQLVHI